MSRLTMLLPLACLKRYFLKVLPSLSDALLEFKSRPGLDEGIFESYVHLNIVVPGVGRISFLLKHVVRCSFVSSTNMARIDENIQEFH